MELIRGVHNLRQRHRGCVGTIGAFDGVHLGHRALLGKLLDRARELGLPSVVVCFEPLPREYFSPADAPARLMSFREKVLALSELGVDRLLRIHFDEKFSSLDALAFINRVFVEGLDIRHIVVGDDLRFGAGRTGDVELLRAVGGKRGFQVEDTASVRVDAARVSSSRIRAALECAQFDLAHSMLGYPYGMTGRVVLGRQLGRTLGVPTANLELHRSKAPMAGVYAVEVRGIGDRVVQGVANVGMRPTVGDRSKALLEVHLFDFDADIYGCMIQVIFRAKIRDEQKFSSIDALRGRMQADIDAARRWCAVHGPTAADVEPLANSTGSNTQHG